MTRSRYSSPKRYILLTMKRLFFAFVVRPRRARWLDSRRSGEAVLSERYARGEIDEAEYRRRREVLREGGAR